MKQIWAPWRMEYLSKANKVKENDCVLCLKPRENDDEANLILFRGKSNFIILNAFPYNPGHLMVAPYRHSGKLQDLTDEELMEHSQILRMVIKLLGEVFNPGGFNIGMNIGKAAGAGIEKHLHTHVVPRWEGDTNFMPALADTKVMPETLAASYKKLKAKLG